MGQASLRAEACHLQSTDPADLFRMLSQEEAKHKLALETLYDDLMAEQGD